MKVSDILSIRGDVVTSVGANETVRRIVQRLRSQDVGALLVNGGAGCLDGMVTERDVMRGIARYGPGLLDLPVSAIATTAIVSCSPDDRLSDVARVLTERHLVHIPVKVRRRLVDIISLSDIIDRQLAFQRDTATIFFEGFANFVGSRRSEEAFATR